MPELADALTKALAEVEAERGRNPCGCKDAASAAVDPFAMSVAGGELTAELNAAMEALSSRGEADLFSPVDEDLESEIAFADLSEPLNLTLEEILEVLERNPGLKITLSY